MGSLGWGWPPSSDPPRCLSQALTVFQRSLTTMQMQTQGLIQFALPLFPMAEVWGGGSGVWSPVPICSHPSVLHRKTSWGSSSCSTPQRPACISSQPCWTAAVCTR